MRPQQVTVTTPEKPTLYKPTMQHLAKHFSVNVNEQCVIMKVDYVDIMPSQIRSWLINILLSEEVFESAIMESPNPTPFKQVCKTILYDFFSMTHEGPLNRFIGERKYTMDRIVPLFNQDYLDKDTEKARNICVYMVQCIGDQITLSQIYLDKKHFYKISQIKSAMLPFSFDEVEKFMEVFELLYALMN
ncbi:hypothetical protein GLOIN_2v1566052 [Rhizophagus clarus]|uniref:Uncharacterized protein n=1 Tax=Rhizophagus clarus TaxID=94130 RepID=A0A8H3R572_9GLOM|nr:hypothetical protein GLOIN_2v1566052 [Rhizophagus clarus]